ncbi:putative UPF0481 protein At3g02645 [Impatiens glandulifera]|uniref:putative UPF0481 protein At3g02645 n=1 Tax=Impatiens glandulifera TaxID=253017 RepID=UPI001FB1480F|nr:putative UPF0481 protein At3g02645 [Impatiens glandulifera]
MALSREVSSRSFSRTKSGWIGIVSKILENEICVDIDVPVSIFRVPKTISVYKPQAYIPHVIGLGPYHHFDQDLYDMERYKLAAATRLQKKFHFVEFADLIKKLGEFEHKIRACYHKHLDMDGETLTWLMAIDGMFLLEFLYFHVEKKAFSLTQVATAHLVDPAGRKLVQHSILSDIMMLENQFPIFFLREILLIQSTSLEMSDDLLPSMLFGFCKMITPLKLKEIENIDLQRVLSHPHLLDLLYNLIVPKFDGVGYESCRGMEIEQPNDEKPSRIRQLVNKFVNAVSNIRISRIIAALESIVPILSTLKLSKGKESSDGLDDEEKTLPVIEEIMIPSVTELVGVGIQFIPTNGGISTVRYDEIERKFYLPVITLNCNAEVVLRNLVAYEASIEARSLVLARFMELMNGIVDTREDSRILREAKIVVNSLKSDEEVTELFNGMSKSVRLTRVLHIDKAIADINCYYDKTKHVGIHRAIKKYVYGFWRILVVIMIVLLMSMMFLQSFCEVYDCPRIFKTIKLDKS